MKSSRILVCVAVVLAAETARAGDAEPPRVELPLGPYVRPGRPLDVRVVGGADRVRAPGAPWALPQGTRGDEFLLQLTDATAGVVSLEIERRGMSLHVAAAVETLPADARIVGVRGDAAAPAGWTALRLPADGLPTVREGWLLLDDVQEDVSSADIRATLARVREFPALRAFAEPTLLAPDRALFETTADAAARGPRLPADVATLLVLLAAAELTLVVVLRFRDVGPWRRAAWLAAPAAAACAWLVAGDRLPGALAATAVCVDGAHGRLVVVRVEARRDGGARFELPRDATSAPMVRYAPDDATVADAEAGREVMLRLSAGESRVFAYALHLRPGGEATGGVPRSVVPSALEAWLVARGLRVVGDDFAFGPASVPRSRETVVVPVASAFASSP